MEFEKAVKERRSIRKYTGEKVSRDTIMEIIENARFAPSWKNTQIARYIVVEDEDLKNQLAGEDCLCNFMYNARTIGGASCIVVMTYKKNRSGFEKDGSFSTPMENGWEYFDSGIAAQTFCLAAHDKGVGTVIMGYVNEEAVRKVIDIPEDQGVTCMIGMGYPDKIPECPGRKAPEELVTFR